MYPKHKDPNADKHPTLDDPAREITEHNAPTRAVPPYRDYALEKQASRVPTPAQMAATLPKHVGGVARIGGLLRSVIFVGGSASITLEGATMGLADAKLLAELEEGATEVEIIVRRRT